MVLAEQLIFWVVTGVFAILVGMLAILFKKNLDANSEQAKAVNLLTKNVAILAENMKNFQSNCTKIESMTLRRIEDHDATLDELGKVTASHEVKLDEHGRRIDVLEKKRKNG